MKRAQRFSRLPRVGELYFSNVTGKASGFLYEVYECDHESIRFSGESGRGTALNAHITWTGTHWVRGEPEYTEELIPEPGDVVVHGDLGLGSDGYALDGEVYYIQTVETVDEWSVNFPSGVYSLRSGLRWFNGYWVTNLVRTPHNQ